MEDIQNKDDESERRLVVFGRDLSAIPCFRNSWLYGISSGIGSGLLCFLFTSKPRIANHIGFATTLLVAGSYWSVCRYQITKQEEEIEKLKEYVQKRVLIEGTEMEKVYQTESGEQVEVAAV